MSTQSHVARASQRMGLNRLRNGCYRDAVQYFKKALQYNPDDSVLWHDLGCAYERLGNYEAAEKAVFKSLKNDNSSAQSWYRMARIYARVRRDIKNVLGCLSVAVSLNENLKNKARHDTAFQWLGFSPEFKKLIEAAPLYIQRTPQNTARLQHEILSTTGYEAPLADTK